MLKTVLLGTFLLPIILASSIVQALPNKYIVVPNRGDSTIAILSTPEAKVLKTITEADTGFRFEPIYASSLPRFNAVAVSDRRNNQVLFFDNNEFTYLGAVPASRGMFHMWPSPDQKFIYVVADLDRVIDVIEINREGNEIVYKKQIIDVGPRFATGMPHDIVVDAENIFFTMLGVDVAGGKADYVVKHRRSDLRLLMTSKFSFDIHLGLPSKSPYLLVPEQTAGRLNFLDKNTLATVGRVENVPGSHGIYWSDDASKIYLANFTSVGPMSLYEVRQKAGTDDFALQTIRIHDLDDAKAHNIVADFENQIMFVTHSGPNRDGLINTKVSVFSIKGDSKFIKTVKTGDSPLGILLVDRRK